MTLYTKVHRLIQRPPIWRAVLFPSLAFILFLATTDQPYPVPASASDKINHIMAFICLGTVFDWSYPRLQWTAGLGWLLGYGLGIELVQAVLPYREFSLFDLIADTFGAAVGLGLGMFLRRLKLSRGDKEWR